MKTQDQWLWHYRRLHPELVWIEKEAKQKINNFKKAVYPYQAAALYHLARPYDGERVLEIGTAFGYSCFFIAKAMPNSQIVTLNISQPEIERTKKSGILAQFPNIQNLNYTSWEFLEDHNEFYGFVFVDGDHNQIEKDIPFFNWLVEGGLIMFHDYSPANTPRPCPPVYEAINKLADQLGRGPDVLIIDEHQVGMAGFIRNAGDAYV